MPTGIETATLDLQRENEERLWQEGILRHVPVVGTFVNWWSPKNKESGVRGRSLNLTQGVVESTENIYKYHMQIAGGSAPAGTKSPPTPLVQTPVGGSHSRSSSHASNQSLSAGAQVTQGNTPSHGQVVPVQVQGSHPELNPVTNNDTSASNNQQKNSEVQVNIENSTIQDENIPIVDKLQRQDSATQVR